MCVCYTINALCGRVVQGVAEALPGADGVIDMHAFILEKGDAGNNEMHLKDRAEKGVVPVAVHAGYRTLSTEEIGKYLVAMPLMRARLGLGLGLEGADSLISTELEQKLLTQMEIIEVGDGNLNLVYLVHGPTGTVVVKQALPYVRCVGESWPLTLERADFEQAALVAQRSWDEKHVPEVFHFNRKLSMFVMEFVPPPHTILRKLLMEGGAIRPLTFAEDLSTFLANTLFNTSALAMSGGSFREAISKWSKNTAMCALTEQVITG
jgi:5-methylthioribose kinase